MNTQKMMRKTEKRIAKLTKRLNRQEAAIRRRLDKSCRDVKNAIFAKLETDEFGVDYRKIFRVDQETGECVDFLVYFPEYDIIAKVRKYLEAYLITNEGVLDESTVGELEGLMNYFI